MASGRACAFTRITPGRLDGGGQRSTEEAKGRPRSAARAAPNVLGLDPARRLAGVRVPVELQTLVEPAVGRGARRSERVYESASFRCCCSRLFQPGRASFAARTSIECTNRHVRSTAGGKHQCRGRWGARGERMTSMREYSRGMTGPRLLGAIPRTCTSLISYKWRRRQSVWILVTLLRGGGRLKVE